MRGGARIGGAFVCVWEWGQGYWISEGGSRTSGSIVKPGVTSTAMGRGGLGGVDEEASVDATASVTERAQLGTILVSRRIVPEGGLNGSTRPPT